MRFSITWDGGWQGYRVSVPKLSPMGEPVDVVTLDEHEAVLAERDRYRRALEEMTSLPLWRNSWYATAQEALTPSAPKRSSERRADAPSSAPLGETQNTTDEPR